MNIKRGDLVSTHYSWSENEMIEREDDSPCRKTFNRTSGYHMLWLANWYDKYATSLRKLKIGELETLIAERLPVELRSEISVCHWVLNTAVI